MPSTKELLEESRQHAATPFRDLFDFHDAACVITGAAKGIGFAVANRFGELGARLVLIDIDEGVGESGRRLADAHGADVTTIVADVGRRSDLDAAAERAMVPLPRRLVWVNSAGIYPTNLLEDMGDEDWARVIDLDLTATFSGCRAAALAMRRHSVPGVIVNLSSIAGFRVGTPPGIAHYAAAKHGVQGLTKALAVELGPDRIRVVAIAPGTVITDGLIAKFGPVDPEGVDDRYSQSAQRMPIRRPSLPDDIARAAVFLASPAAAQLTGTILPVDAGHLTL